LSRQLDPKDYENTKAIIVEEELFVETNESGEASTSSNFRKE
jgi:hypothetical protein